MGNTVKPSLNRVLAKNLAYFMARTESLGNANALGLKAKIAPNTVSNLLRPHRRTVTDTKPEGYPTLDKLARIAAALGIEVWELLHPDIEKSLREREMYRALEKDFRRITSEKQTTTA